MKDTECALCKRAESDKIHGDPIEAGRAFHPFQRAEATLGDQIRNMHTDLGPGLTTLAAKAGVDLSDPCVMCKAADALDAARTLIVCLEERIDATEALKTGDLHLAYRQLREMIYG